MTATSHWEWIEILPLGLIDTIKYDMAPCFSLETLLSVEILPSIDSVASALKGTGWQLPPRHIYTLTFRDDSPFADFGNHFPTVTQRVFPSIFLDYLIEGYSDVLTPSAWIDRLIMDRSNPEADYSEPDEANRIVARLLDRGDEDKLLQAFARHIATLLCDQVEDGAVFYLKWAYQAAALTPVQICTAAYRAKIEVTRQNDV